MNDQEKKWDLEEETIRSSEKGDKQDIDLKFGNYGIRTMFVGIRCEDEICTLGGDLFFSKTKFESQINRTGFLKHKEKFETKEVSAWEARLEIIYQSEYQFYHPKQMALAMIKAVEYEGIKIKNTDQIIEMFEIALKPYVDYAKYRSNYYQLSLKHPELIKSC
ncbi:MAG: hypothetical protein ABIC91_08220 [Nanoarchaeota archaeon]|nr:hypothetical protein [Nanoarchaeota archaeon]MBU1031072.1 hypothetical protein [Nanoarchaeota archaeon]MBU1850495.1 hypothetical protein [Nanoarchaeota archaeon]